MVRMPWMTYLWPGLPQLWHGGLWSGLALAAGFATLINWLLLASFVWVELLSPQQLRLAWLATGGVWIALVAASAWYGRGLAPRRAESSEAMFREAISEYLKGNWFEAERILGRRLHLQPRDVEARLMLATLLRHTERYAEALDQLSRLELQRDAGKWVREIAAEKAWIAHAQSDGQQSGPDTAIDIPSPTASPWAA